MASKTGGVAAVKREDELRINETKWSKTLMDAGWTAIPSVIIERQKALGLDSLDLNILLYLATYWWTYDNKPRPSKRTVAEAIQVTPRTVQRRIAEMERAGLIKREERRVKGKGSRPNVYHFDGLIKEAKPYAMEKLSELEKRRAERANAGARKGKAKLQIVSSQKASK